AGMPAGGRRSRLPGTSPSNPGLSAAISCGHDGAPRVDAANYRPDPRLRIGAPFFVLAAHPIGFTMPTDYRPTVFLPKTDFPSRGGLPTLEPMLVERWQAMGLYDRLRQAAKGREKFVLHDGPPYANGDL